ncbi:MAG TPA: ATP-binding protein [Ramlibacter sp.]|nr:ATP-binding protein [Ramlibacter sp.]
MQWITARNYPALSECVAGADLPAPIKNAMLEDVDPATSDGRGERNKSLINSGRFDEFYGLFDVKYFPTLSLDGVQFERIPLPQYGGLEFDSPVVPVNIKACSEGFDSPVVVALFPENHLNGHQESDDSIFYFIDKFVSRHLRRTRPILDQFVHGDTLQRVRAIETSGLQDSCVHWVWLHEHFHRVGPAPVPEYLEMKSYRPLAGLEECRVDMLAICAINDCEAIPREKVAVMTEFILAERLLRYSVEGIPTPNYDAIGSQVLVNYLRREGHLVIEDGKLRLLPRHLDGVRSFVDRIHSIEAAVATSPMKDVQARLLEFVNAHMNIPYGSKLYQHDPFFLTVRDALNSLFTTKAAATGKAATLPPSPYPALEPGSAAFEMTPEPKGLGDAMAWLEARMAESGLAARPTFALSLCLDEAVANVLMHGFAHLTHPGEGKAHESPRIRLTYRFDGKTATIEVQDNGMPFDSTQYVASALPRSLQEAELGGHGIRLMRNYLSQMRYRREGSWNILTLALDAGAGG